LSNNVIAPISPFKPQFPPRWIDVLSGGIMSNDLHLLLSAACMPQAAMQQLTTLKESVPPSG
jgi:hypothetical protein